MAGKTAVNAIEEKKEILDELAQNIWEHPEGPFREVYASNKVAELLEKEGFAVERGAGGVPTAIRAVWGEGHPVIGLLGEYDALPGLSQQVATQKLPVEAGAYGHGCGHNLLAATTVGGAIGMKAEMQERNIPGTIVFYGCPAEETLTGKPFMARGGCFYELDFALAWHPSRLTRASIERKSGCNAMKFRYRGTAAHAAFDPWNGRSALDAVSLLNTAVEYMREHVRTDVRIHYVITEGGLAPNIVPEYAEVWYVVRALRREQIEEVSQRIERAAEGAAMMTDTELHIERMGGCYPLLANKVIADALEDALREIPREAASPEEKVFAASLNQLSEKQWKTAIRDNGLSEDTQIFEGVAQKLSGQYFDSSDVGDVSHIVPTGFFYTATYNLGAPGHSWQATSCAGSDIGKKGMHYGAKVMAVTGIRLMEDEELRRKAKEQFLLDTDGEEYKCIISNEVQIP